MKIIYIGVKIGYFALPNDNFTLFSHSKVLLRFYELIYLVRDEAWTTILIHFAVMLKIL